MHRPSARRALRKKGEIARSYRRLDQTRRTPVDTDPTFDQLARLYRRDQESRNLSGNTLKVTEDAFALFRRFMTLPLRAGAYQAHLPNGPVSREQVSPDLDGRRHR
jgi:hypothetical protein